MAAVAMTVDENSAPAPENVKAVEKDTRTASKYSLQEFVLQRGKKRSVSPLEYSPLQPDAGDARGETEPSAKRRKFGDWLTLIGSNALAVAGPLGAKAKQGATVATLQGLAAARLAASCASGVAVAAARRTPAAVEACSELARARFKLVASMSKAPAAHECAKLAATDLLPSQAPRMQGAEPVPEEPQADEPDRRALEPEMPVAHEHHVVQSPRAADEPMVCSGDFESQEEVPDEKPKDFAGEIVDQGQKHVDESNAEEEERECCEDELVVAQVQQEEIPPSVHEGVFDVQAEAEQEENGYEGWVDELAVQGQQEAIEPETHEGDFDGQAEVDEHQYPDCTDAHEEAQAQQTAEDLVELGSEFDEAPDTPYVWQDPATGVTYYINEDGSWSQYFGA